MGTNKIDTTTLTSNRTAHWSKDYVEHLRAVHFALISTCVVLILLSVSRNKTEIEIAQDQNRQIEELLNGFHSSWFNDYVPAVIPKATPAFPRFQLQPLGADTLHFQHQNFSGAPEVVTIPVDFGNENWIITGPPSTAENNAPWGDPSSSLPRELSRRPTNLREFRVLWDNLANTSWSVNLPEQLSTEGYYDLDFQHPASGFNFEFIHTGKPAEMSMSLREWNDSEKKLLAALGLKETSSFVYSGKDEDAIPPGQSELDYPHGRTKFTIVLPVTSAARFPFDGQGALIAHTNPQWKWYHGTFDQSFHQLSKIVKNYETLPPKTIDDILASERERTGETFDAVGLKLPAEDMVRFGILLIVCVQLYLWVHLREKSLKLQDDDEGWEVAWIGVYQSRYAGALMFVSICLLPFLTAVVLSLRGLESSSSSMNYRSLPYWSLLAAGNAVVLALGLITWRQLANVHKVRSRSQQSGPH
jgi:hypothetical protein